MQDFHIKTAGELPFDGTQPTGHELSLSLPPIDSQRRYSVAFDPSTRLHFSQRRAARGWVLRRPGPFDNMRTTQPWRGLPELTPEDGPRFCVGRYTLSGVFPLARDSPFRLVHNPSLRMVRALCAIEYYLSSLIVANPWADAIRSEGGA